METGAKGNCAVVGMNLDVTKCNILVGGYNDIDGLDCAEEGLVKIFFLNLEFE
jgi:hypothetical protein